MFQQSTWYFTPYPKYNNSVVKRAKKFTFSYKESKKENLINIRRKFTRTYSNISKNMINKKQEGGKKTTTTTTKTITLAWQFSISDNKKPLK